jgi:hypothetical protein
VFTKHVSAGRAHSLVISEILAVRDRSDEPTSWPQDSRHLGNRLRATRLGNVLEYLRGNHDVEVAIAERHSLRPSLSSIYPQRSDALHCHRREVEGGNLPAEREQPNFHPPEPAPMFSALPDLPRIRRTAVRTNAVYLGSACANVSTPIP